jgi:uncharacterized protein (DUF2147 family)
VFLQFRWFSLLTHSLYNPQKGEVILNTTRRKTLCAFAFALLALVSVAGARAQQLSPKLQNAVGHWQIVNSDGTPGGKADTYLENGKLFGRVTEVRPGRTPRDVCDKCSGEYKNQLILGMVIMRNFHPDGDDWVGGTVVDPENGKEYQGKIWAVGKDNLHMRGFIGISLFGRTESWVRIP